MSTASLRPLLGVALLLVFSPPAFAQTEPQPRPSFSRMVNIDALLDNHARFLARRYNLTEDQENFTRNFLKMQTDTFLQRHRDEVYDLVDRLMEVRAGAEIDQQELIAWGRRALPVYTEAKRVIVDGNMQWREILTDEQKRVHDQDLAEMNGSFATTEDQLQRIVAGQMTVEEFRRGPVNQVPMSPRPMPATPPGPPPAPPTQEPEQPAPPPRPGPKPLAQPAPPAAAQPAAPRSVQTPSATGGASPRTAGAKGTASQPAKPSGKGAESSGNTDFESQWEQYVREFCQRYQLEEAQVQKAYSILRECQELARRQLEKRKPELERLDKKQANLAGSTDPEKAKELAELNERKQKLLQPIGEIFEKQLKPRLEKLPTRAQRQAADAESPKAGTPSKTDSTRRAPAKPTPPAPTPPPSTPPAEDDDE